MNTVSPTMLTNSVDPMLSAGMKPGATKAQEVEQVGEQFEAVFMSMLTKQLRETLEDGMFSGENSDSYGALFDMYLGQHMAEAGGIGIKKMLVARYSETANAAIPPTSDANDPAAGDSSNVTETQDPTTATTSSADAQ